MNRRDFVVQGALLAAATACRPVHTLPVPAAPAPTAASTSTGDAFLRDLALRAIDAARTAGASYADTRVVLTRTQSVATRERQVTELEDQESLGFGVRVVADGAWGFAASALLSFAEAELVARQAVAQAKASARARRTPVVLAPVERHPDGEWRTPIRIDAFTVPVEEKLALLFAANEAALGVRGVRFVRSSIDMVREEKLFASTEGTVTSQTIHRCWPQMSITAVAPDRSDFQTRNSTPIAPMGRGWDYVLEADLAGRAPGWGEEAVRKLSAKPVEPGRYDLVLLPSHLFLTLHESVAHPTELDRILGEEANFAGTSFMSPPEAFLGKFRLGPELMNIQGERSAPGGLATTGWDDEGVKPDEYLIVKNGIVNDLQTTREQAPRLAEWYSRAGVPVRSHGNAYAQSWADVQFQRMPNVNLLPHPERDVPLDELVDGVKRGILVEGRGSYSIDQQRYNAQFGGQVAYEIRDGKVGGMLKDVVYQIRTPEFWRSMDLIGGPSTYALGGTFNDGKGQPAQSNAVSHGCPVARFRGVGVINAGRSA